MNLIYTCLMMLMKVLLNIFVAGMFDRSILIKLISFILLDSRVNCMDEDGIHPMFVNVNMHTGQLATTWIDALQASFSAVQVLRGDIEEAICLHAVYYSIWRKFGVLPERFNWQIKMPDVLFYPLRPEFIESTYFLYQATKNPFYLHVGRDILDNLNAYTRVE